MIIFWQSEDAKSLGNVSQKIEARLPDGDQPALDCKKESRKEDIEGRKLSASSDVFHPVGSATKVQVH